MGQYRLFEKEVEMEEEVKEEKEKISQDEKYKLISFLYKSCRIGDYENAMKVAEILRKNGLEFYVAQTLVQLVGEDLAPSEWQRLYPTISEYYRNVREKRQKYHDLPQAVFAVARAKKWYQTEDGEKLEVMRQICKDDKINIEFPNWVFDYHTREGRERIKNNTADLRLDGRWGNRFNIKRRWDEIRENSKDYDEAREKWIKSHYDNAKNEVKVNWK